MKLEHFRSDCNGQRNDKPYHKKPSDQTIREAQTLGKVVVGDVQVFASENLIEVRAFIGNGISGNSYRDFYRIV